VDADGVPHFGSGTEAVYERYVLLRTWLVLQGRQHIDVPVDVEELLEGTYDDRKCTQELPDSLRDAWAQAKEKYDTQMRDDAHEAAARWIKRPAFSGMLWRMTEDPREEDSPQFHRAHQALTRLAEISVPVVAAWHIGGIIYLDADRREIFNPDAAPDAALTQRLLSRSVSVTRKSVVWNLIEQPAPPGWNRNALLRHHKLLALNTDGVAFIGNHIVRLDCELGLVIDQAQEAIQCQASIS